MVKRIHVLLACCFTGAYAGFAQSHDHAEAAINVRGPLEKMPVSLEARFALSALPPALRDKAGLNDERKR